MSLVDKYDAYQVLDDVWNGISTDLEMMQTEGFEAVKKVDANIETKKKDGKTVTVQNGWIGHIIPFDLIQSEYFAEDVDAISNVENRMQEIEHMRIEENDYQLIAEAQKVSRLN